MSSISTDGPAYQAVYAGFESVAGTTDHSKVIRYVAQRWSSAGKLLQPEGRLVRIFACQPNYAKSSKRKACKANKLCPHCRYRFVARVYAQSRYKGSWAYAYRQRVVCQSLVNAIAAIQDMRNSARQLRRYLSNYELCANIRMDGSAFVATMVLITDTFITVDDKWNTIRQAYEATLAQAYRWPLANLNQLGSFWAVYNANYWMLSRKNP